MRGPEKPAPVVSAKARWPGLLLFCAWLAQTATAVEIHKLDVIRQGGVYRLEAESTIAAPPDFVYGILMDCNDFHRLTSGIIASRRLPDDGSGEPLCYTQIQSCVWFYCRSIEKVERFWTNPGKEVVSTTIQDESDFKSYVTRWQFDAVPGGTRIRYMAVMEPDFWIPPVIGTWAVRSKLELTAQQMGARIEYLYKTGRQLADLPDDS